MRFGISTLRRTICTLLAGAFLLVALAVPAEAQRRGRNGGWWDNDRHDNGRHLGWTRGRRRGWDNDNRWRRRAARREWREDRREWRRDRREWRRDRRDWRRNRTNFIGPRVGANRGWRY